METIRTKIEELLQISKEDLIGDKDFGKKFNVKMKQQEKLMDELEVLAKANKTILGRIIRFQMADSYAYYLITSVGKTSVQLKWINYCDAWVDDRCGYGCRMSLSYVTEHLRKVDALNALFSSKQVAR